MSSALQPNLERIKPIRRGGVVVARGARGLLRLCVLILFICVVLVAVITGGARIGLPFLTAYKPSLELRLSEYLQSPVTIEELDARWAGTGPELRARGVQITDPQGRVAKFDELLIDLNVPRSLFAGAAVMDELTLVGAKLAMEYSAEGGVLVHGVSSDTSFAPTRALTTNQSTSANTGFNTVAWLLTGSRVGMLDTQLTVQMPDNTALVIENVNIRAENRADLHQIRMDLSLPSSIGGAFEIGADIRGDASDLSTADGNFYIKAADFKAAGFHRVLSAYGVHIPILHALSERGTNAQLELWGDIAEGDVQRVNGRTAIAQSGVDDPYVDSLFGDLAWARNAQTGWQFVATDVVLGRPGQEAVFDEIRLGTAEKNAVKPEWVSLKTAETALQPVVKTITTLLPTALPPGLSQWLKDASPSAKIRLADVALSLVDPAQSVYVNAQIDDVQWLPRGRQPGVRLESLIVDIDQGRGSISLPEQTLKLLPPTLQSSVSPVDFEPLEIPNVSWIAAIDLPNKSVEGQLRHNHGKTSVDVAHRLWVDSENDSQVAVDGEFESASVLDIKPWFTQSWIPTNTRRWLDRALVGGRIEDGKIRVSGSLAELKSRSKDQQGSSVLQAEFKTTQAEVKFLTTWPAATNVTSRVLFNRASLSAEVIEGRLGQLPIAKARAVIDNLFAPELQLSLASETTLNNLVDFGVSGPLKRLLTPVIGGAVVTGPARLEVAVVTPLRRPEPKDPSATETTSAKTSQSRRTPQPWPISVSGNVFLQSNDITLASVDLPLKAVRGPVAFTENGVEMKSVRGTLFGSPVRLNAASAGTGSERRTDIALRAVLPGKAVLERFNLPVATFVSGSSQWRADASVPHNASIRQQQGIRLTLTSDLVGTTLTTAEPLRKQSAASLPLRITTRFNNSSSQGQIWRLLFGDSNNPKNDIRVSVAQGRMQGLVMSLGKPLGTLQPDVGIRVIGQTAKISLDGLVQDIATVINSLPDTGSEPSKILPVSVDVYGQHMQVGRTLLGDVNVRINTEDDFLNLYIKNKHLRGSVRYPREHWRKDTDALIRINYSNKVLIDALTSGGSSTATPPVRLDPRTLPPIDMHVSEFEWDPFIVNELRIRTEPDIAGMRVRTFGFATNTTQLLGEGLWHLVDPQNVNPSLKNAHRAQLHLTLQSSDFGQALNDLGFGGVMAEGEGRITASLNWPDALYSPSIEVVSARATVDIKRGRLLQLDPGAARIAGLFALQTLPRRLNLDFTDLVNNGLDFATITGDIAVDSGVADMRLVQLNGPVGVIDVTGTSNLVTQQFDQRVTVLPRVSAALPIIGIISGGASAGIGALLAGGVLKAMGVDFDRIGLREFTLRGSWQEPVLSPVKR